jgi:transposase
MKLTQEQRKKIISLFPKQRGNVKVDDSRSLDALISICENGREWRALPETFGPRRAVRVRINRRAKNGVLERVFHALQEEQMANKRTTAVSLDSSSVKARPDAAGALKKNGRQALGKPRGGLNAKTHMMAADNQRAIGLVLSGGAASDASDGRLSLDAIGRMNDPDREGPLYLLMERDYEDRRGRGGLRLSGGVVRRRLLKKPEETLGV